MGQVRVGVLGRIASGENVGRFVEVVDDSSESGGFLILTYEHADRSGDGSDSWVETIVDVDLYFEESDWDIEWMT
jgi:hypothetical protein